MNNLEAMYREKGMVCSICDEPYKKPMRAPKENRTACAQCWEDSRKYSRSDLWPDTSIENRMKQMKLCGKHYQGCIGDDNADWQNEQTLRAVRMGNWKVVLEDLSKKPHRVWRNMSQHILVKACEHSDTPEKVIAALLYSGVNPRMTRPCINPGSMGAMTPVAVAAEKGNVSALKVFEEEGMYGVCDWDMAANCAVNSGQADALDIIWSQERSYSNGHEVVSEKLYNRANVGRIIDYAKENGYSDILEVVKKYFPERRRCQS